MAKLLYSGPSPYSAKVRMAAAYCGFEMVSLSVNTVDEPDLLLDANPLGKIPVLILDDGTNIFDSRAIMQFIDRDCGGELFGRDGASRTQTEHLEALCDGICDCLLAQVYELRFRPQEMIYQPWLDKQWSKAIRALANLNANCPEILSQSDGGQIALRALLGYLDLRFAGKYEDQCDALIAWRNKFDIAFPALAKLSPH